jgi:AcrR family transcriptional regulator
MCRASATFEPMLVEIFSESEPGPLPIPIVRGVIGGLHGAVSGILRQGRLGEDRDLAEDMLRWTLLFWASCTPEMTEHMMARSTVHTQEHSCTSVDGSDTRQLGQDDCEQLLHSVLRLATLGEYRDITTPQIAEDAGVPLETFDEIFAYRDECYLAAVEMVGEEIVAIVADSDLSASDWPGAVRRVVKELMCHLAARPVYAQTIAQEAFSASAQTRELTLGVVQQIATLLTKDAPSQAQSGLAVEAIAGAILHTVRYQVAAGRIHLLAAIADDLTCIVLAPFIGADAAFEAIREY